ncbi:class I SAM-dependent methyltransferase [Anaerovorax odorimutans]|uniref:class I SAM-dependent methyltransferase n=1 Tax=Anaerovorax odorimutans TaxID=109327 RepID=UPI0003F4BE6F|nr:class I SAM-dependent methyltransferase [Anaerovorax odorimutans]
MNISQIRECWVEHADKNNDASIQMWDSASKDYREKANLIWKTDNFLKLLSCFVNFSNIKSVLDIGCGVGLYTIALAEKVNKSIGIDFSPNMIRYANERAKKGNIKNVQFICKDWCKLDIRKEKFEKDFDLVIAYMSPAICSAETFEKLIACSKKYCYFVKPTIRKDCIFHEVEKLVGLEKGCNGSDETISFAFDMALQLGYKPNLTYRDEIWKFEKTLEEAYAWYIGRVKTYKNLTDIEEKKLREYLNSISNNGKVKETIKTTIVSMYWEV